MRNPCQIVTPPASEPVTRAELVAQLRLNDASGLDAELDRAITSARELFEAQTGRAVLPTTIRQFADAWGDGIPLQVGPVTSVSSVQYYDTEDALQTLAGTQLDSATVPALVYLASGAYPALSTKVRRPVRIQFIAGWANAAAVPAMVRLAILMMASNFYEHRLAFGEDVLTPTPEGWERVVALHKTGLEWAA